MMRNILFFIFLCFIQFSLKSQTGNSENNNIPHKANNIFTITDSDLHRCFVTGLMYGGGSIFGFEIENKITDRLSIQHGYGYSVSNKYYKQDIGMLHLGVDYISFGGGLNYHLKPTLRSSYISVQYWTQGVINEFLQGLTGPVFVYRSNKLFTAQVGLGYVITKKPILEYQYIKAPFMLTYAIGFYLAK
jgi:hypothetical protein